MRSSPPPAESSCASCRRSCARTRTAGRYGNDSTNWFSNPPFAEARSSPVAYTTYNEYAAAIYRYSDAYGFSFSDTGPKNVQLPLDDARSLEITILPDSGSPTGRRLTAAGLLAATDIPAFDHAVPVASGRHATVGRASCPPLCGTISMRATTTAAGPRGSAARGAAPTRRVTVGRATVRLKRSAPSTLRLKLTRRGRALVHRRGDLPVSLRITRRHGSHGTVRATRRLRLRLPA